MPDNALQTLLHAHFPSAENSTIASWAAQLNREQAVALAYEFVEQKHRRDPMKDADDLMAIGKRLKATAKIFDRLGAPANEELWDSGLLQILNKFRIAAGELNSAEILSNFLIEVASTVEACANSIESGATETPNPASQAKQRKRAAELMAERARLAFEALSDEHAAVRTNALKGEAYGPFLDFVAAIFHHFSISGSPEAWARKATRNN
ncbi:hypothetical protein [Sulfitobacter dubius]|uniref:hypothetical protein n=1 Tax=Sulfitobacter dubius TaxID=218673 RepID=UPI0008E6A87A|nr:hypothetical protein [Sulfitobacter dubius]SFG68847.1 hypothetical protein SAMN04488039_1011673 [Sulfitobacter dubius]